MDTLYNKLRPGDENSYFINPAFAYITIPGAGPPAKLCAFNSLRVALIIGVSIGPIWVSPDSSLPSSTGTTQPGIELQPSASALILLQSEVGPLCQLDWYANIPTPVANAALATVIEVVLREQPSREFLNETLKSVIRPGSGANGIPRNSGTKPTSLWDMVFSACRGKSNRPK